MKLKDIAIYVKDRVEIEKLSLHNYISTENMLPEKGGVQTASSLPSISMTSGFRKDDILTSNIRPYFKKIWIANKEGGCSNDVLVLRAKNNCHPKFLYYVLSENRFFDYSTASAKGTKMPRGDKSAIMEYKVPDHCVPEQIQIADILSSLDDKIAFNKRINDNLEQQAQALYKSWFVDFEPFKGEKFVDSELGKIPEGWRVGKIGNYCKVRSGYAFKSSWWTDKGCKVIKIKNITEESKLDLNNCSHVLKSNTIKASDFMVSAGDVLIAMTGATIGKFCIVPYLQNNTYVNQRVGKFFLGNDPIKKLPFLYNTLKQGKVLSEIISKGQGSAQPNISGLDIENISIIQPTNELIQSFNALLIPLYLLMLKNEQENIVLANKRDSLLPKLMSGELKTGDLHR